MNIELYNDDCLKLLDSIKHKLDLVIMDLPYGQTDCEWDKTIDLDSLWLKLTKIAKPTTPFIFFTTTKFGYELIKSNEKWFRYDLVWSKTNCSTGFLNSKKMPLRSHEMIYVFYQKLPTYNVSLYHTKNSATKKIDRKSTVYNGMQYSIRTTYEPRLPKSVMEFGINTNRSATNHPTEKPIELLKWLIKYYSNEGDVVLDPCMGSGSTGVACKELNRYFIGIEMNKDFYDVACKRIANNDN